MLDVNDFNFLESAKSTFDFKGFMLKLLSYWKWFVACLIITFIIAYNVNVRKEKIYGLDASIVVKDENNSFFTSNTSLVFNWGGVSEKVQTVVTTLKSRTHNEVVVDKLEYYVNYLKQGKYNLVDVYGLAPFYITIDKKKGQLLNVPIKLKFISEKEVAIHVDFKESPEITLIHYFDNSKSNFSTNNAVFEKTFSIGKPISLPFLNATIFLKPDAFGYENQEYYISFSNFDSVVSNYKDLGVSVGSKAQSVITLQLQGTNKYRLVEYLNTTIQILKKNQLESKNKFATNTITFIDSTLANMEGQLKDAEVELKDFRRGKNVYELQEGGGQMLTQKLSDFDVQKDAIDRKLKYLNHLKSYLQKNTDFSHLPAPSVAGIEDPNILANVSRLIQLSAQRDELGYAVKSDMYFSEFDSEMDALKKVLLENIESVKGSVLIDLNVVNRNIAQIEGQVSVLPEQQQEHLKITRKYNLKDNIYNTFLQKRSEAEIIKASNVSDIEFIDAAKDIGGGLKGPKTSVNYILAAMFGLLIPFSIVFVKTLLDNNINTTEDIVKQTNIPVIGVVGKKNTKSNLSVIEKPKSPLAESFRAIRSSLQFLYKKQSGTSKIVMLTSSVSGEGKTFCSINLATVFALSEKKTILVGLDLRKPKIFGDFNINNEKGVVNYLIGQKKLNDLIQQTELPYLDVLSSGPIPPNPSELLLGENLKILIDEIKETYDYIILDTPPVGLVADALELAQYCDATLYVTRQGFTKKGMLSVINEKHRRKELHNISIVLNGFQNKVKYGYGYGSGYGYGYGEYGESYLDSLREKTWWEKLKQRLKKDKE